MEGMGNLEEDTQHGEADIEKDCKIIRLDEVDVVLHGSPQESVQGITTKTRYIRSSR